MRFKAHAYRGRHFIIDRVVMILSRFLALHRSERQQTQLSDKEFDDILQRNKSVSSGAIMRAVQDASEGHYIPSVCIVSSFCKQIQINVMLYANNQMHM